MSNIMPERTIKVYPKDAPWMSVKLKELIRMRQQAFHANKSGLMYKHYRNAVNKERKRCKAKYYASKVKDLKGVNPRQWWSEVNKLSGSKMQNSSLFSSLNVPEYNNLSPTEVANSINHALLEPLQPYEPIDSERAALQLPLEENPEILEVTVQRVYNNLLHLNKHKASGPDGLSNWVLKEYAEILVTPVQNILNASYSERKLPSMWKIADVTPLPKVKQVTDTKKDLRPISLTSTLSKISEDFIVSDYIKPALESLVDPNQFGTISGSSTVLALISMIHKWLEATDGNGASVRVLLFDYRKAFDLIDHKILVNKLKQVNIPNSVINWVIDFLSGRSQRVKLGKDCVSEWGTVPSGVPQGTKLGPWLFLLMINDLTVPSIFDMWKYVDDTTVSEIIPKGQQSKSQKAVDAIYDWSKENLFQLNGEKTKELVISFSRDSPQLPRVCIDGTPIKTIQSTKLLGLTINDTLTWNDHIEELVKKASKKLYFLIQLKRAHVPTSDLVTYFCACIRSTLDYACPVFHHSLPMYQQVELERVQRRALSCIFPRVHYSDALQLAGLESIRAHQGKLTEHLFKSIVNDPRSKITSLLPPAVSISHELRRQRRFATPLVKTNRFANSFIVKSAREAFK